LEIIKGVSDLRIEINPPYDEKLLRLSNTTGMSATQLLNNVIVLLDDEKLKSDATQMYMNPLQYIHYLKEVTIVVTCTEKININPPRIQQRAAGKKNNFVDKWR